MKIARRGLLMLLISTFMLTACGEEPTPTPPAAPTATVVAVAESGPTPLAEGGALEMGVISGRATHVDGEPLPGATVTIRGTSSAGENTYFEMAADGEGRFAQKVPDGLYEIRAYVTARYKDRTYGLWLDPVDGIYTQSQASSSGIVKDFVWKVSGLTPAGKDKPDSAFSYYGGVVEVGNDSEFEMQYNNGNLVSAYEYPAGSMIRVTFTPDGALVDGSAGDVVKREIDPRTLTESVLRDIPLGDYIVTASLIGQGGGSSELRVATIIPGGKIGDAVVPGQSAPVVFKPEAFGSFGFQAVTLYILPAK